MDQWCFLFLHEQFRKMKYPNGLKDWRYNSNIKDEIQWKVSDALENDRHKESEVETVGLMGSDVFL